MAAGAAEAGAERRANLPLAYLDQAAHFTTPANDVVLARKAFERGTAPTANLLERAGVRPADLAERLGVAEHAVVDLLEHPRAAPLVMLDGEDAVALQVAATEVAPLLAAEVLAGLPSGSPGLRFFRPPGFGLGTTVRDLFRFLWALREASDGDLPLDGLVIPKIETPGEVELLYRLLDHAEDALDIGRPIRVAFLVESGRAVMALDEIVEAALPRLAGLILGIADYSADVGLRSIDQRHPVVDHARAAIVNAAGAVDVPPIDAMTLDYPTIDPNLSAEGRRVQFLDRMQLVYDDAVRARDFGMAGKWVGHPAQLFAVLLAYDALVERSAIEAQVARLEAYRRAVDDLRGAAIIDGSMSDRATDRHARMGLRRAAAIGGISPERALALGVIDRDEATELGLKFNPEVVR